MSKITDDKLADLAKWFHFHKNTLPAGDIHARMKFLETTVDNLCLVLTYVVEDLQKLEGRRNFIIPNGIKLNDEIRNN